MKINSEEAEGVEKEGPVCILKRMMCAGLAASRRTCSLCL